MICCDTTIHVGTIGFDLIVQFLDCATGGPIDLLAAGIAASEILLRDPAGLKVSKVAVFLTDGTDGKIHYVTVGGDLDVAGPWRLQGKVADAGPSKTLYTEVGSFTVRENLEP